MSGGSGNSGLTPEAKTNSSMSQYGQTFGLADPYSVNLSSADPRAVTCYILRASNDYNGQLGARVSAIFVIMIVSTAVTFFPVLATRQTKFRVPLYVYLFARYFGAGVIVATAFVHLLDPAYGEIGPNTCVGMTGGWAGYSWPPAIAMTSAFVTFLMDFAAERYVDKKYHIPHTVNDDPTKDNFGTRTGSVDAAMMRYEMERRRSAHQAMHSGDQDHQLGPHDHSESKNDIESAEHGNNSDIDTIDEEKEKAADIAFKQQIAAFLILEFGVLFHSVIIGLTLGTAGSEFSTLYPVIVFHQSFEGLGIGARLSAIPFPKRLSWMPWALCTAYGLTTPVSIAIALGVRTTYNSGSFTANVVSGLLDSISAGILMYTGFVELIARDFLFNPDRTDDDKQLAFMCICLILGAGIMALLGKWA